jgi:hypothetical protein
VVSTSVPSEPGGGNGASEHDVAVVRWPAERARRDRLVELGRARLLVVADGVTPPPAPDGLEDWVRDRSDAIEVYVRTERLRSRQASHAAAVLDSDGLLHRGPRWVALSPRELQLARLLLARPGSVVGRAELLAGIGLGAGAANTRRLDTIVRRLHLRIALLGFAVHTVRGVGFLLEVGELPV